MADMLKFRKGQLSQINEAAKVAGTIYIATDEKAMYVDINGEDRIRIGDLIRVKSISQIEPPYSTTSLYFVEDDNALLGYDGKDWKQINGTEELEARIEANEGNITTLTGKVSTLETTVGNDKSGLVKQVADNITDITALKAAVGMNEDGDVAGLAGSVAALQEDLTEAEKNIESLVELTNGHTATLGEHTIAIAANAKAISDHKTEAAQTYATKDELKSAKEALQSEIDSDVAAEAARAKLAEEANATAAATAQTTAEARVEKTVFEQFKTDNTTAIGAAKTAAIEAAEDYADDKITEEVTRADNKYATKLALEATDGIVGGHTETLATLNGSADVAGSVNWAKKAADEAAKAAKAADDKAVAANNNANTRVLQTAYDAYVLSNDAAVLAAQTKANDAYDLAGTKTTEAEVKTQIEAYGYATTGYVDAAKKAAIDDAATKYATIAQNEAAVNAANAAQTAADKAQGDATQALADAKKANDAIGNAEGGLVKDIADNKAAAAAAQAQANKGVEDAGKAKAAADAAQKTADDNTAAIAKLNGPATEEGSVAKAIADAKSELQGDINEKIDAANAMTYKEVIDSVEDLPTSDVKVGDTYVVGVKGLKINGQDVYPGDLVIATGEEIGGILVDITWAVVNTGYDASLEQTIATDGNSIKLSSVAGANNGAIAFVAEEGTAAKVSVADNTVTIGMQWFDF